MPWVGCERSPDCTSAKRKGETRVWEVQRQAEDTIPYFTESQDLGGINQEWLGLGSLCLMTSGIQLKTAMGIDGMAVAKQ